MGSAEMKRVRESFRQDSPPPESTPSVLSKRHRDSIRREEPDTASPPPREPRSDRPMSRRPATWESEAPTGTRRKRSTRPPVSIDQVGATAVKLARTTRRSSDTTAPKLVASRTTIAKAPIDTRAAFILSLIDGSSTLEAIIDIAGMPQDEVRQIFDRLVRLGLVSPS